MAEKPPCPNIFWKIFVYCPLYPSRLKVLSCGSGFPQYRADEGQPYRLLPITWSTLSTLSLPFFDISFSYHSLSFAPSPGKPKHILHSTDTPWRLPCTDRWQTPKSIWSRVHQERGRERGGDGKAKKGCWGKFKVHLATLVASRPYINQTTWEYKVTKCKRKRYLLLLAWHSIARPISQNFFCVS